MFQDQCLVALFRQKQSSCVCYCTWFECFLCNLLPLSNNPLLILSHPPEIQSTEQQFLLFSFPFY